MINQKLFSSISALRERPLVRKIVFVIVLAHLVVNPWAFLCSSEKLIPALDQQIKDLSKEGIDLIQSKDQKKVAKTFLGKIEKTEEEALLKEMSEIK